MGIGDILPLLFVCGMLVFCTAGVLEAVKQIWPFLKAKRWPLWLIAGYLSAGSGVILALMQDFGLGLGLAVVYAVTVYILQYIVDFALIKKLVRRHLERLADK